MAGEIRNVDGLRTVLIFNIAPFADFQVSTLLPAFYTYREKGNMLINFWYLMHGHQIVETILVSNIFQSESKCICIQLV